MSTKMKLVNDRFYVILSRSKQNLFVFDGTRAEAERHMALIL